MIRRKLLPIHAIVLLLSWTGCITTKSSYDIKAAEADSLRSALAELNREKAKLIEETTELSKRETAYKENETAMTEQIREMERSLKRLAEGLTCSHSTDEKRWLIREQFIENLIDSEKAAERRIEELAARAEACEAALSRAQNGTSEKPAEEGNSSKDQKRSDRSDNGYLPGNERTPEHPQVPK